MPSKVNETYVIMPLISVCLNSLVIFSKLKNSKVFVSLTFCFEIKNSSNMIRDISHSRTSQLIIKYSAHQVFRIDEDSVLKTDNLLPIK